MLWGVPFRDHRRSLEKNGCQTHCRAKESSGKAKQWREHDGAYVLDFVIKTSGNKTKPISDGFMISIF